MEDFYIFYLVRDPRAVARSRILLKGYNWDYDQPADDVLIRVSEDPNDPSVRTYDFVASFGEGNSDWGSSSMQGTALNGSFTVSH